MAAPVTIVSEIPRAGCRGKRVYESMAIAGKMAKRMRRQLDGAKVGPYRCDTCHKYHVGSGDLRDHNR